MQYVSTPFRTQPMCFHCCRVVAGLADASNLGNKAEPESHNRKLLLNIERCTIHACEDHS